MPFDAYHGDATHLALGLRVFQMQREVRIAAKCIRCNRFATHTYQSTWRHFREDMPVDWLPDLLTLFCVARKEGGECRREIVSPDDGCSDEG